MKRWVVDLQAGVVELAALQNPNMARAPEYCADEVAEIVFVLAVDELGAFVRAKQLLAEAKP